MKRAFTMIELIFVIVIIGILASMAIPSLMATRDDAKASLAVVNLSTCIMDISTKYTATGNDAANTVACDSVFQSSGASYGCWTLVNIRSDDGNITINNSGANTDIWCTQAHQIAENLDLNGTHRYGASSIVR